MSYYVGDTMSIILAARADCGPVLKGTAREMHQASFDWICGRLDQWGLPTEA